MFFLQTGPSPVDTAGIKMLKIKLTQPRSKENSCLNSVNTITESEEGRQSQSLRHETLRDVSSGSYFGDFCAG